MSSDTPRTDAYAKSKLIPERWEWIEMCEQLERELNVAKERIKNLESALCTVENIDNVNAYQDLESANKRIKRLESENDAMRADLLLWENGGPLP
jgi:predicted  nucleic acid-binding Zn-ribbon protein